MPISAGVILPKKDVLIPVQVINLKHDSEGNHVGVEHNNPVLDTRIYEVQFPDGQVEEYMANMFGKVFLAKLMLMSIVISFFKRSLTIIKIIQLYKWMKNGFNMVPIKHYEKQHMEGTYIYYGMMVQPHGRVA
jgi:hypothetical protein